MNKNTLTTTLILLPIYWLFSGMLVMKSGDKPMVALAVISIITTLITYGLASAKSNLKHDKTLWVILAMTGYALFSYHYHGLSSREIRALLTASLFLVFFPRHLIKTQHLAALSLIGSICSLIFACYYGQYIGLDRPLWPINAIPQATMSAAIGLLSITAIISDKLTCYHRYMLILAFILSTIAILVSQSRGIWIGYFICLIFVAAIYLRHTLFSTKTIICCFAVISLCGFTIKPILETRLSETQHEINQISAGNLDSSIGLRLQMWMAVPTLVSNNLVLGLGNSHHQKFNDLYQQGYISSALKSFNPAHYHNQYLDRLVKNGLIGLALFIAVLVVPFIGISRKTPQERYMISTVVLLYAIASLTDVPFNHAQPLLLYAFLVCGFLSPMENNKNYV